MPIPHLLRSMAIVATVAAAAALPAAASASPFATGPDPTAAELAKPSGPYPVRTIKVPQSASPLFGVATIYAPVAPAGQTFGGVGVSPGFLAEQWTLTWLARRIATHGFVTIVFTPNHLTIEPPARSRALAAALEYLKSESAAKELVDPERLAVLGHSMGGGASVEAARANPDLKAAVAIAPWSRRTTFPEVKTPTLVLGFKPDWIAPIARHAKPIFAGIPEATTKSYLELNLDHAAPSLMQITDVSRPTVSWLKRYVDDDERYDAAICPAFGGVKPKTVTAYRGNC